MESPGNWYFFCRCYVISSLPSILVLDDHTITSEEREEARKIYGNRRFSVKSKKPKKTTEKVLMLILWTDPNNHRNTLRDDFLNAVYFRWSLTCTLGITNDLIDGGQPRAKPHLCKAKTKISPRSYQGLTKIWRRSYQDLTKISPRSYQDLTKIWPRSDQDLTKVWPRSYQGLTKISPRSDQDLTKVLPRSY